MTTTKKDELIRKIDTDARGVGDLFFEDDFARLRKAAERAVETMDRKESRS